MLAVGTHKAAAHDGGWATAGAVLGGVAVGSAIAAAVTPHPVYYSPPVVYSAPPVVYGAPVCSPAPVYVQQAPAPVVVYSAPVYAPYRYYYGAPLVSFGWGWHGGHYYHHGHR